MEMVIDPITGINTVLCIVIVFLGVWSYARHRKPMSLLIGLAFAIFGVSHILTLLGLEDELLDLLVGMRVFAYLLVVIGLWGEVGRKK